MMARSLRTPSIGRIQKRKTNLLQIIIFRLATRGRSIQKGHVWTAPAVQEESDLSAKRSGAAMYSACFRVEACPFAMQPLWLLALM
jgi:hypothetical protein